MAPVTIVKSETDASLDQACLAFSTFVGTTNVTVAAGPPELRPVQNSPCCPWSPDRDRVPAQRRHLPRDAMHQPRETIVAFDAARLGIDSVLLVALLREFLFESPRPRPHSRIFDCDLVGPASLDRCESSAQPGAG